MQVELKFFFRKGSSDLFVTYNLTGASYLKLRKKSRSNCYVVYIAFVCVYCFVVSMDYVVPQNVIGIVLYFDIG